MPNSGLICSQCNDVTDVVTPLNDSTHFAKTMAGEMIVALHTRCEKTWAEKNNCERLVPLRKLRRRYSPGNRTNAHSLSSVS